MDSDGAAASPLPISDAPTLVLHVNISGPANTARNIGASIDAERFCDMQTQDLPVPIEAPWLHATFAGYSYDT